MRGRGTSSHSSSAFLVLCELTFHLPASRAPSPPRHSDEQALLGVALDWGQRPGPGGRRLECKSTSATHWLWDFRRVTFALGNLRILLCKMGSDPPPRRSGVRISSDICTSEVISKLQLLLRIVIPHIQGLRQGGKAWKSPAPDLRICMF